mmetsp:Transcript_27527/g.89663  ORF Transcript_27527/g.89663 Transcript_27527/m.89663 type:complete len:121 (-) Transcript_27527:4-366(-)
MMSMALIRGPERELEQKDGTTEGTKWMQRPNQSTNDDFRARLPSCTASEISPLTCKPALPVLAWESKSKNWEEGESRGECLAQRAGEGVGARGWVRRMGGTDLQDAIKIEGGERERQRKA